MRGVLFGLVALFSIVAMLAAGCSASSGLAVGWDYQDMDGDGIRNGIDADIDGDGVPNEYDVWPHDPWNW